MLPTLSQAAEEDYRLYPDYCNPSVIYVIRQRTDPAQKMVTANDLIATMTAGKNGWQEVSLQDASRLADQGKVVIGGLAEPGHGHVVIVMPGPWKPAGGFDACAPAGDADLAVLGSEWQTIHRFVEICRVCAPDGKIPIEVTIVRLDRMFAIDLFLIAPNVPVPKPVFLDTGKHIVAMLEEELPIEPPGRLSIVFADWRSGFPWRVDMREDSKVHVVSHYTWPLRWDPAEHRYVDRDKRRH